MTNFSSKKRKKEIITPENSLLFIPAIIGVLILTLLLGFVYRPLKNKLNNEEQKIKALSEQISYISRYKQYINQASMYTSKAKNQQNRLINLISDPQELETILSEINRICIDNDIDIINIVPRPIIKYTQAKENKSKNSPNKDPFLIRSLEKHIFKLTIEGEYNRLLDFLKELELLQTIVITDQIEIKSKGNSSDKDKVNLSMSFNLTTYARLDEDISEKSEDK